MNFPKSFRIVGAIALGTLLVFDVFGLHNAAEDWSLLASIAFGLGWLAYGYALFMGYNYFNKK